MSIQKFSKYSRHLDLIVMMDPRPSGTHDGLYRQLFRSVRYFSADDTLPKALSCHLLICTLSLPAQESKLKEMSAAVQRLETLVLSESAIDEATLRLALSLRASHLGVFPDSEEGFLAELAQIFPALIKKYNETLIEAHRRYIVEHSGQLFFVLKGGKTVYTSDAAKHYLGIQNPSEIDAIIGKGELGRIVARDGGYQGTIQMFFPARSDNENCFVMMHMPKPDEKIVTLIPLTISLGQNNAPLLNRMSFIELLKDAYIVHSGENEPIPVVMIHIENSKKIIDHGGEAVYNDACRHMVSLAKSRFTGETQIAQWHKDVFTMISPGATLEELKEILEGFTQEIRSPYGLESTALLINAFVIDMRGVELNKAIEIIDNIHQKHLVSTDLDNLIHHEFLTSHEEEEEDDHIHRYLEKIILSKTPVRLLNFYKGLRISTPGKLIKFSDGMAYVAIEKIQAYAMKLETNTVLQSGAVPFDLQAGVKIVDVGKKVAVLSQFNPLKVSANNRRYTRIQSDHRMHVTLSSGKSVISGTIMDISIKSIACRIGVSKVVPVIDSAVTLQFNLPNAKYDQGMVSMFVEGKIEYVQTTDEFTKVVVVFDLDESYEHFLIEYIYERQQALINEIKTIASKL